MAEKDAEKGPLPTSASPEDDISPISDRHSNNGQSSAFLSRITRYARRFEEQMLAYNLEVRGIKRVEVHERHDLKSLGYTQIAILWFSINLAANNITLGMLGPAVYYLSFRDAAFCAVFGMMLVRSHVFLLHLLSFNQLPCDMPLPIHIPHS